MGTRVVVYYSRIDQVQRRETIITLTLGNYKLARNALIEKQSIDMLVKINSFRNIINLLINLRTSLPLSALEV